MCGSDRYPDKFITPEQVEEAKAKAGPMRWERPMFNEPAMRLGLSRVYSFATERKA